MLLLLQVQQAMQCMQHVAGYMALQSALMAREPPNTASATATSSTQQASASHIA